MTGTSTTAPVPVERTTRPRPPRVFHAFPPGAIDAAAALNVEARARCGVWRFARHIEEFPPQVRAAMRPCRRCLRVTSARRSAM